MWSWLYSSWIYNYLFVQSMPITTKVLSSNPAHGKMYSIQHYVIKFVGDLRKVGGFLWVLRFPPPIKLTSLIEKNILLKVALYTLTHCNSRELHHLTYYIRNLCNFPLKNKALQHLTTLCKNPLWFCLEKQRNAMVYINLLRRHWFIIVRTELQHLTPFSKKPCRIFQYEFISF